MKKTLRKQHDFEKMGTEKKKISKFYISLRELKMLEIGSFLSKQCAFEKKKLLLGHSVHVSWSIMILICKIKGIYDVSLNTYSQPWNFQ